MSSDFTWKVSAPYAKGWVLIDPDPKAVAACFPFFLTAFSAQNLQMFYPIKVQKEETMQWVSRLQHSGVLHQQLLLQRHLTIRISNSWRESQLVYIWDTLIDFGGFDTYKRERISGLQNVKMPTFLFSSNRELSGYRLRSRRRSPPRRAVCSGNAPSEKMSPQSERAPTKNRQQERPLAVSGKATPRRAEGKLKKNKKNAHYTVAKKKITDNLCEGSKRRDGV